MNKNLAVDIQGLVSPSTNPLTLSRKQTESPRD